MKRIGILPLGLAALIAILCWQREQATSEEGVAEAAALMASTDLSGSLSLNAHHGQFNLPAGRFSQDPADDTLVLIRLKLSRLSEIPKADKDGEDELIRDLLGILTDTNAAEVTRALSAEELQSRFGLAALQHWLKVDAWGASDWIATRTDASEEQAGAVAQQLAGDLATLNLYCAQLPDNAWREIFLKQAALAVMRTDPSEAIQLVQQISSTGVQLELLQTAICTWMIDSPAAAADWVAKVRDPVLREELVGVGARTLAASDPLGAIDWLFSNLPRSSEGSELLLNETFQDIFATWVETAPAQAARAVAQLPSGDLRETTLNVVWQTWIRRDPAAAVEWIKNLPERERMQAVAGFN